MRFDGWDDFLCHHGIKGQKWGIRRYQNPDGTLTEEGKKRYREAIDEDYDVLSVRVAKYGTEYGRSAQSDKWYDTMFKVYDSDYRTYKGAEKKAWDDAVKKGQEFEKKFNELWEKTSNEIDGNHAANRVKYFFERHSKSGRQKIRDEKIKAYDNNEEVKRLIKESTEYHKRRDSLEDKMGAKWKDKTLREILKTVPEDMKDDVYRYYRFHNYTV